MCKRSKEPVSPQSGQEPRYGSEKRRFTGSGTNLVMLGCLNFIHSVAYAYHEGKGLFEKERPDKMEGKSVLALPEGLELIGLEQMDGRTVSHTMGVQPFAHQRRTCRFGAVTVSSQDVTNPIAGEGLAPLVTEQRRLGLIGDTGFVTQAA